MNHQPLFSIPFLASRWEKNYTEFKVSGKDGELRAKLRNWNDRKVLSETASEAAFIKLFFSEIWGYSLQGENSDGNYQCHPQFPVSKSGQLGGTGRADAGHSRVIDFYALGRIFEQSITELEIMEAEADGRPSINLLSKRKRDGVFITRRNGLQPILSRKRLGQACGR